MSFAKLATYVRALKLALTLLLGALPARAGSADVIALPASPAQVGPLDYALESVLPRIDQLVSEGVQDLGLTLALEPRGPRRPLSDELLVERAREDWVVEPTVAVEGNALRLRLVVVEPGSSVLRVRSELVLPEDLDVKVVVMLRDLVVAASPSAPISDRASLPAGAPTAPSFKFAEPRSTGRAVLALNGAVFGGYVGYSIQRASGSADARLVYPLVALGTGAGLGASMLVADEWDIDIGGAWFLSAGLWWPTASGLLGAASQGVSTRDRYVYGVVAGSAGLALSAAAMSLTSIGEGDAALAHSGGALGLGFGGLTELFLDGSTRDTPIGGMGYGAALGTLSAGLLATQFEVRASRVLLIDLGATLGALTGAAVASPLLLVDEEEGHARTRLWLGSIAVGTLLGGGIGWWSTRGLTSAHASATSGQASASSLLALPYAVATPEARGGSRFEAGLHGRF